MYKLPFRFSAFVFGLVGLLAGSQSGAFAEVAQKKDQVPGYYRLQLGKYEVTALYDGFVAIDKKVLSGASDEEMKSLLEKAFLPTESGVQTAVNGYLINTGSKVILIDAGTAKCFGPSLGYIPENLKAAGYKPEDVDLVLLTHLHGDHACGLLDEKGEKFFPKAKVQASKEEADFWLNKEEAEKASAEWKDAFKVSQTSVAPYIASKAFETFTVGETLTDGVRVVPTFGHTPGHISYLVESEGQKLMVWGDIIHSHAIQFAKPEVAIEFDTDKEKAVEARKKMLKNAAQEKFLIGGAHLPFPGIGHVQTYEEGYRWVPVEFSSLKGN